MGFISSFILPKGVDFNAALQVQTDATGGVVTDLRNICIENNAAMRSAFKTNVDKARILKTKNMKELLYVFITPYDKESIYRFITELDWVALSATHFLLEADAYDVLPIREYQPVFNALEAMTGLLEQSVKQLPKKSATAIAVNIDLIHEQYETVISLSAKLMAAYLQGNEFKHIMIHTELLTQLKEVAKRIRIAADSLEDMAIKIT
ncbi:MAG: hypothetical protein QNK25_05095 [Desulfobacterales bacterium]|nr:hypothetical protein [Desulfobacterales bacterium]